MIYFTLWWDVFSNVKLVELVHIGVPLLPECANKSFWTKQSLNMCWKTHASKCWYSPIVFFHNFFYTTKRTDWKETALMSAKRLVVAFFYIHFFTVLLFWGWVVLRIPTFIFFQNVALWQICWNFCGRFLATFVWSSFIVLTSSVVTFKPVLVCWLCCGYVSLADMSKHSFHFSHVCMSAIDSSDADYTLLVDSFSFYMAFLWENISKVG